MSAPTGNTNATHWTREKTHHVLDQIESLALDEFSICHTLTQALQKLKYYKQLWSYFKAKWEMDGDIMDRIYYIENVFIGKLEEAALFRRMHPGACYFILRHNYGYNTKGENELPSHLRADLEEHMAAAQQSASQPAVDQQQSPAADSKATKEKPHKRQTPAFTDPTLTDRFGLDVRKNPQMYSKDRSPALVR